jgi:hypothetical protein
MEAQDVGMTDRGDLQSQELRDIRAHDGLDLIIWETLDLAPIRRWFRQTLAVRKVGAEDN